MRNPVVHVLSLGGTIAMTPGAGDGVVPNLDADTLVKAVPDLAEVAHIHAESFLQKPGAHLAFDDIEYLAAAITDRLRAGADGVVITQGTDTVDETAFALDRLIDRPEPVVVTGAMRNPTLAGADGPANLLSAVRVAASRDAIGMGTLVVINDTLHAARFVRKANTSLPSAFVSALCGPVGWIVEKRVRIATRPTHVPALGGQPGRSDVRVALVTVSMDDVSGTLVDMVDREGFEGLVIEAMGGGHVPPSVADAIERVAEKRPVMLASRTGDGEVLSQTYGFPGSEIDLLRRGVIRAGWLDGLKARVLLTLLLRREAGRAEIVDAFEAWGGGAIDLCDTALKPPVRVAPSAGVMTSDHGGKTA